ncbi:hypothetical protein ABT160_43350 [Streptomyces sp. NPDC001941]
MPIDPFAALNALLRAEASRLSPTQDKPSTQQPAKAEDRRPDHRDPGNRH